MNYLRSLLFNFLVVFFVNRVAPGLSIAYYQNVPDIGDDLLFSAVVGFFNASVFPLLAVLEWHPTNLKIALGTFVISYGAFLLIYAIPFGVSVTSPLGVFSGGSLVWIAAFITNHLEFVRDFPPKK